jgi:large subunit ribosomal protein L7/L12
MSQRIGRRCLELRRTWMSTSSSSSSFTTTATATTTTTTRSFSSLLSSSLIGTQHQQSQSVSSQWQYPTRQCRQFLHSSSIRLAEAEDEKELSPKEKKKALKAKAKAMTQAGAAGGGGDLDQPAAADAEEGAEAVVEVEGAAEPVVEAAADKAPKEEAAPVEEEPAAKVETPPPAPPAAAAAAPKEVKPATEYSTPELTRDAAAHKAGLLQAAEDTAPGSTVADEDILPSFQNPLHHDNPEMGKIFREDFDTEEAFEAAKQPAPPFVGEEGQSNESSVTPSELAPEYLNEIADEIVNLTMLEMNELINKIADHYDFDEGMLSPDDDGSGGGGGGDDDDEDGPAAAAVVEKTIFDIKLTAFDPASKIKVIKEVRAIAGLGLKEAKEMVEGAPKTILKDIKKEQAEEIKAKLEELGATVEIV